MLGAHVELPNCSRSHSVALHAQSSSPGPDGPSRSCYIRETHDRDCSHQGIFSQGAGRGPSPGIGQ